VRITMNRPDIHNAFDELLIEELTSAFRAVDPETTRAVVLTGAGQSFSAGADLNWMKKMAKYTREQNLQDSQRLFDMVNAVHKCPVPVVGRVNGSAFGGGTGLVAACDIAFAVSSAKFGLTEASLGLIPAVIAKSVMDKIGKANCARFFVTAERFPAQTAKQIGLINEVVDNEAALDALVTETTDKISRNSPQAVRKCKEIIESVARLSLEQCRELTTHAIAEVRVSKEGQEGLSAFLERRPPAWLAGLPKPKANAK